MALRGIIFDLDGVIVDTVPAHYAAWHRMFTEEGYHFDEKVYHDKVDGRRRQDGVAAVMEGADLATVEAAGDRKNDYFLDLIRQGKFQVFETSVAFVKACRAAGLSLATASSSRNVSHILQIVGLEQEFQAIVGGDDVSRGKPNPDIFLHAAAQMGLTAAECIVLEDATSGVKAAKAGGFYCIGVDRVGQPERLEGADRIIGDLGEISPETLSLPG